MDKTGLPEEANIFGSMKVYNTSPMSKLSLRPMRPKTSSISTHFEGGSGSGSENSEFPAAGFCLTAIPETLPSSDVITNGPSIASIVATKS